MKFITRTPGILERRLASIFRLLTATLLFFLMILTCADVIGRYFLNRPVAGGLELTEILLAGMIFTALPIVSYRGEHIAVGLITLPGRWVKVAQHFLINILGSIMTAVLAYQLWLRALRLGRAGETTVELGIPMYYVALAISFLMALTAVAFFLRAFRGDSSSSSMSEGQL
jgi:TRAP-type C4-dicarboxylate transport system permease small subunit